MDADELKKRKGKQKKMYPRITQITRIKGKKREEEKKGKTLWPQIHADKMNKRKE